MSENRILRPTEKIEKAEISDIYLTSWIRQIEFENAELRNGINRFAMECHEKDAKIAELEKRVGELEEALKKYGVHDPDCGAIYPNETGDCECGLEKALTESKSAGG